MNIDMETFNNEIDEYNETYEYSIINEDIKESTKNDCKSRPIITVSANCNLQVDVDPKNRVIYLCPRKLHFFVMRVSKCCGNVTIKYKSSSSEKEICGELAIYNIVESGIIVQTYSKLDYRKKDVLCFTAIDECTKQSYDFSVIFAYDPCECRSKCCSNNML